MARTEWLRTFAAACQTGSVTEAARLRNLSQPAATSHVRSLEALAGVALFVRRRDGVTPTDAGRRLFAQVAGPLERLDNVLAGLDGGSLPIPSAPIRIGASPEIFAGHLAPHLTVMASPVEAVFGTDDELTARFVNDEIDLLVAGAPVTRKGVNAEVLGHHRYTVVGPPELRPYSSLKELADGLAGSRWVSYSSDLPRTRRFWKQHLGRSFDADVRLVAPDLRVILSAIEAGIGASLLPTTVCERAIERGTVKELFNARDLVDLKPLWGSYRSRLRDIAGITRFLARVNENSNIRSLDSWLSVNSSRTKHVRPPGR